MASIKKLIQKMKSQPYGISYDEAARVLEAYGYHFDRQQGSHCQFNNADGGRMTLPKRDPLKRVYIEIILEPIGE